MDSLHICGVAVDPTPVESVNNLRLLRHNDYGCTLLTGRERDCPRSGRDSREKIPTGVDLRRCLIVGIG